MAKKSTKKTTAANPTQKGLHDPWISMRSGLIIMGILSLGLAAYIAWQVSATQTLLNSILYGLVFGGSLWLVFLGFLLFNRWIRRG